MRKFFLILAALVAAATLAHGLSSLKALSRLSDGGEVRAMLGYNPRLEQEAAAELDAYASVLQEEGVPFRRTDLFSLLDLDAGDMARRMPALILPDRACASLNSIFALWIEDYLRAGGNVAIVYDAGVRGLNGSFLPHSFFAGFTGVEHATYSDDPSQAYTTGRIRFRSPEAAASCGIPPGKLDDELYLCGYGYGRLTYPVARSRLLLEPGGEAAAEVLAEAVVGDGEIHPAITTRRIGSGTVTYVNLPLGHLKGYADDLPLRAMLRRVLFADAGMPHLMAVPRGVGGVVFNWHVDANDDWAILDRMADEGFFPPGIDYSIHICAGESLDEPGDGKGFDAAGAGRRFVTELARHGEIGSHGGWYHNYFARQVESGKWGETEIRRYVQRNMECLEEVTGREVREYSAPAGVHPPRIMARLLPDLGVNSYYYTGDGGSAPNRSFTDGTMLAGDMIAFPVMPLADVASLGEMDADRDLPPRRVREWLDGATRFCRSERTVRLLYSHPYNLYLMHNGNDYREAFRGWLADLDSLQRDGRIKVAPMGEFADFMLRMLRTEQVYSSRGDGLRVELRNPLGLRDLAVAVPAAGRVPPRDPGLSVTEDGGWYYIVVEETTDAKSFTVGLR